MWFKNFPIMLTWIVMASCTRHQPSVELSYYFNVLTAKPATNDVQGLSCPAKTETMYSLCQELFLRPHYRYELKVDINTRVYVSGMNGCRNRRVQFKSDSKHFPTHHYQVMFTCFGRHTPIRTQYGTDDYLKKFFLGYTKDMQIFYVFQAEYLGEGTQITLYEEILNMFVEMPHHVLTGEDVLRETQLHFIETTNHWPPEIENIFVREMILDTTPIQNQLATLAPDALFYLCTSLLYQSPFADTYFSLDQDQFQTWNGESEIIRLYFGYEGQFNNFQQGSYPCYGLHFLNKPIFNQKFINMFRLSSGRRTNSVFLFTYLWNENNYKIMSYTENVNFAFLINSKANINVQPSKQKVDPSE